MLHPYFRGRKHLVVSGFLQRLRRSIFDKETRPAVIASRGKRKRSFLGILFNDFYTKAHPPAPSTCLLLCGPGGRRGPGGVSVLFTHTASILRCRGFTRIRLEAPHLRFLHHTCCSRLCPRDKYRGIALSATGFSATFNMQNTCQYDWQIFSNSKYSRLIGII